MEKPKSLVIYENGWRARLDFVAPSGPVGAFAADELGRYLARLAGEPLPAGGSRPGLMPIVLEVSAEGHLPQDAFAITVSAERIHLCGSNGRGVLYAVYALLEELGCLWVYPTAGEEIVPWLGRLELDYGRRVQVPAIAHRGLGLYGLYGGTVDLGRDMIDWMGKNRMNLVLTSADRQDEPTQTQAMHWPQVAEALLPELAKRGMILEHSEHMTHLFFPPSLFDAHPAWFALIDGKRQCRQMCFSNEEAVAFMAARFAEYAAAHPEIQVLGTWPLDGGGYCECEACQRPGVAFAAIGRVAEAVAQVRPDLTVEYLAYTPQTLPTPVDTVARANMSTLVCDHLDDLSQAWVKQMRSARGAYYFEYTLGDNYRWKANVWLRPEEAAATARAVRDIGYQGVISLFLPIRNWWRSALNTWFFARACWQGARSVRADLDLYAERSFGRPAPAMRPLLDRIFSELQDPVLSQAYHMGADPLQRTSETMPTEAQVKEALANLRRNVKDLSSALAALEEDAESETVALRLRRWRHYVEYFGAYYETRTAEDRPLAVPSTPIPHGFVEWVRTQPASLAMVNVPADFVEWRFDKFVAWGG